MLLGVSGESVLEWKFLNKYSLEFIIVWFPMQVVRKGIEKKRESESEILFQFHPIKDY